MTTFSSFMGKGGYDPNQQLVDEHRRFEQSRVEYLLQTFKLTVHRQAIINNSLDAGFMTFSAFNHEFPTFPFVMAAHTLRQLGVPWRKAGTSRDYHVHRDPHSTEPARFKEFGWVPFVVAYREFYDLLGDVSQKVGLVFPRKGFRHGMIIHNDESEKYWSSGLCWVYKAEVNGHARRLYVQPFMSVISAIHADGHGWRS